MRKGSWLVCMITGLLSLLGCAPKKAMPEGGLVDVRYTRSGTMAGYEYEGQVKQDASGTYVLRAMKESYGPLFEKKVDTEAMKIFRQIIEEEKMYLYKDSYRPKMEVLDGWSWSFSARFSDGSSIDSHGSNASPKGKGLSRIRACMDSLIQDGVQIEPSE